MSRQERIADYKRLLRDAIDQRPSGLRQKIAQVLGTHKSFISQITNPTDPTPVPARHLDAIIDVCHLSVSERERFLEAYGAAHPNHAPTDDYAQQHYKTLHIQVPVLDDPKDQAEFELFIRDMVRRMSVMFSRRMGNSR